MIVGLLAVAFALPLVVRSATYMHILVLLLFYAYLTTSWNIVGGFAGVLPLGHAAFNCIAGTFAPTIGEITFDGRRITGEKPWNLCTMGLARTFQMVKPFASKSVLYNVTVASFSTTASRRIAEEKAVAVLEGLNFADKKDIIFGNLTITDRKRLEIAKALATEPKLLLDEVMAGLRPNEVDEMVDILKALRHRGITIFVIEHIMLAIMALSDRIVVIQFGKKITEGSPKEIANNEKVIKAYLGEDFIKDIFETVRKIADQGTTVLMVEQDVRHSLSLSDRGYVFEHGRVAMEGKAGDLIDDPHIKEAYLGM